MKLLLFVHNFPPEFLGGTEQVVSSLGRAYASLGHDVVVVSGSEERTEDASVSEEEQGGLRVLRLRRAADENYGVELAWPATGSLVTDVLMDEQPDFVHVHHWCTLGTDILQRAAALGIPGGITLHDLWASCARFFRRPPNGIRCPLDDSRSTCVSCVGLELPGSEHDSIAASMERRDRALQRELQTARFVAVPSKAQRDLIAKHLPWDQAEVVPHGLLDVVDERACEREIGMPLRVGSFGNVVPEKGFDLIVEALGHLGEEVELRVSGRCPRPEYVEGLARRAEALGLPFVYTGPYGPADRHPALDLDLAIFPSLCHESYGLVVDEALARGVPVVVSGRGALPERAAHGGVVVRQGGVGPLEIALAKLLRSEKRRAALRAEIPAEYPSIHDAAESYLARIRRECPA